MFSEIYKNKKHIICLLVLLVHYNVHANTPAADIFYGMDQTPTIVDTIVDATSNTTGILSNTANGISTLIEGAAMHSLTAWDFGQTDNYIRVAANTTTAQLGNANTTNGITIGFWTNYNYDGNTPVSYLAGIGTTFNVLAVSSGIIFRFGDPYINAINSTVTDNILDGSWQHIAVTLDFTKSTNNLVMYLNGAPIHTTSYAITAPFHSTTDDLILGARPNGTYPFPGKLDDFIIFDEVLTTADMMKLYSEGAHNFIDVNTYAHAPRSQAGGYDYAWSNYSTNENTGLGTRQINFDYTDVNTVSHVPPVGVHPRLFFSPEDIPEIRNRMLNTESGQEVMAQIHAYTTLMHLGIGSGGYSGNAAYSLDPDGNSRISNVGYWDNFTWYTRLLAEDITAFDESTFNNKRRYLFGSILAAEAFECLIYAGEYDPDTGKYYDDRATDLAAILAFWAERVLPNPDLNDTGSNFLVYAATDLAIAYDINHYAMTDVQRDVIRQALARTTPEVPRYSDSLSCYVTTSNWTTLGGFEILPNLAIEGEPGYKPGLTSEWMRTLYNFITYGWYASGAGYEGLGKNYQVVTTLIAASKRGYSLLGHPHVRAFGNQFLPAITQPYGNAFTGYDDWAGSGRNAVTGGYKFLSNDAVGLKWVFPDDPKVDFMWRNYIRKSHDLDSEGYVYQQIFPSSGYLNSIVPAAIFAMDYDDADFNTLSTTCISEDYFAPERGLVAMRSGTDSLSMSTWFHARQNMGGHTHGDRNDFHMSSLGRLWVRKSYGNAFQNTYFHSCIMIDDVGVGQYYISRQPGKILEYNASNEITNVTGDATYAYTWEWNWFGGTESTDHPWIGTNGWEGVTETFNDFQYQPQPGPYMNTPIYEYPHWWHPTRKEHLVKRPFNPMQRVIRSMATVKGEHPFLLVVDDVQKDANVHNYKWVAQLANDLTVESTKVNLDDCNYQNDIILKEPDVVGNRRLLVRILNNEGYDGTTSNGFVEELKYEDYITNPSQLAGAKSTYRQRLVVESNSVAPNFRVMLYPHYAGDPLPTTIWNNTRDTLRVVFSNEQHFIALNPQNNGEWNRIELVDESAIATTCDDGDNCTTDDNYFANCGCSGVLQDDDNDLICNDFDICPNFNDNLIGTPCDDGDPCTELSYYDSNCGCTPIFNYALPGTPSMSSGAGFRYDYLNDGIVNDNTLLAYTGNGSIHEWMQIDLGELKDIDEVIIYNRTNCCTDRLNNVYVLVADTPFPNNTDLTAALANSDVTYQIGDVTNEAIVTINIAQSGQYVRLQKSGNNEGNQNNGANSLNILEIQIMGDSLKIDSDGDGFCDDVDLCQGLDDNLIGTACDDGDPCTELSVYTSDCNCTPEFNFASVGEPSLSTGSATQASYLTDGIINNSFLAYTSNNSPHEWMQVDLGENRNIKEVLIWNRTNCCRERLNNTYVLVSDTPFPNNTDLTAALALADFTHQIGDASQEDLLTIDVAQSGQYVRLQKSGNNNGSNILNILELQVIGDTTQIDVDKDGICDNACIDIQLSAWLEGTYDPASSEMTNILNVQHQLLPGQTPVNILTLPTPPGQPYNTAPWAYTGTEGIDWTDADYTVDDLDWVLVSFRTGTEKNTEIARVAALMQIDGSIRFVDPCSLPSINTGPLYIVIEHRNHIGIMTPQPVDIVNRTLTYDFRIADSYKDGSGYGQKQLPTGEWVMFAGDGDQTDFPGYDINGTDKALWVINNGFFQKYLNSDYNLDGDVNGADRVLWNINNGIFSKVPK